MSNGRNSMKRPTTIKHTTAHVPNPVITAANARPMRNDSLFDPWSIVHLITGIILGWIMTPVIALAIMVLWEPLEILILSPILGRFGIIFGYETIRNSLSDIFFDVVGVVLGAYVLGHFFAPPVFLL